MLETPIYKNREHEAESGKRTHVDSNNSQPFHPHSPPSITTNGGAGPRKEKAEGSEEALEVSAPTAV